jgi:hypothetical protein
MFPEMPLGIVWFPRCDCRRDQLVVPHDVLGLAGRGKAGAIDATGRYARFCFSPVPKALFCQPRRRVAHGSCNAGG